MNPMEASKAQEGGQQARVGREIQGINQPQFPFLGLAGVALHPAAPTFPGLAETACPAARSRCHPSGMHRHELQRSDALCSHRPPGCPHEASEQRGAKIPLRSVTPRGAGSVSHLLLLLKTGLCVGLGTEQEQGGSGCPQHPPFLSVCVGWDPCPNSPGEPGCCLGSAALTPVAPWMPAPRVFSADDFPAQGWDAVSPLPWCPSSGWDRDVQPSMGTWMSLTAPPSCALRGACLAPLHAQRLTRR